MTAPRGVVLQKDIILIFEDNVLVAVGYHYLNGTFLFLRDGLRFDAWLHLATNEFLNKLLNIVVSDLLGLIVWEFLGLDSVLDGKSGPLALLEVQVGSVGAECFSVDSGEVESALVFLRKGLQGLGKFSPLFRGVGEDVSQWELSLGDMSAMIL